MKTITNKTRRPLAVPLPGGKKLRLGPGKTGQIASKAVDHPPLKKLIDAEQIEVLGEGDRPIDGAGDGSAGRAWSPGHGSGGGARRTGDR